MPGTMTRAAVMALISALLLVGCDRSQSNVQKGPPPPPKVTVALPPTGMVPREDEYVGRFVAVDSVDVRARVAGYLEAVHFRDGEIVEKGAALFTIDRRPFEIALDQARATLEQAKANLELAESDLARAKDLVLGSTITRQSMDQRLAAKRAAEAAVMAQTNVVKQATLDLEFTALKSPVRGRIGDRRVSVGNFVTAATTANSTLLATIQSTDPIRIEFTLDEAAYLRFMRSRSERPADGPVKVHLKLLDEKEFAHEGRMDFMDNAMSRSSGTIRGRAEIANPAGLFAPGMFARVRLAMAPPTEMLLVPDAAIGSEQVRKFVLVVGDDDVARPRYVELGGVFDGLRSVASGLKSGDRVVIDGLMRVRPGMKVAPQSGKIEAASAAAKSPSRAN
ncbi:MAG: efflux RND transporter periplasmic adaptor subunit [Hyphomicrobiaceae bacterium]|nr:efflux RND transporter periplasmic adaptor subunit [Hyphomicrobiaceae bacterium]